MTILVPIAMFGWIPVVLGLFMLFPARRAIIISFLAAWLFLPMAGYGIPMLPDYTKMSATSLGVALGVFLFDSGRLGTFRLRLYDLPMVLWCICPAFSSIANGLGLWDAASASVANVVTWGLPYLIGRVYFNDLEGLRELAIGIFMGGLAYVPFCLFEIKMSPQLHSLVYGYHAAPFAMTYRLGGWRPTVFMQHGLMVGIWMTAASLCGVWIWKTGVIRQLWGMPMTWLLGILLLTTLLCKSLGALALLVVGIGLLYSTQWLRSRALVAAIVAVAPAYMFLRGTEIWRASEVASFVQILSEDRAASLQFRFDNEAMLAGRAMEQPIFGWGGWGRARVRNEDGRDISATDGLWIILLGNTGAVGLGAFTAAFLLPAVFLVRRLPADYWTHPALSPAVVLMMLTVLYTLDNLMNAMVNPIFTLALGGLTGWLTVVRDSMNTGRVPIAPSVRNPAVVTAYPSPALAKVATSAPLRHSLPN